MFNTCQLAPFGKHLWVALPISRRWRLCQNGDDDKHSWTTLTFPALTTGTNNDTARLVRTDTVRLLTKLITDSAKQRTNCSRRNRAPRRASLNAIYARQVLECKPCAIVLFKCTQLQLSVGILFTPGAIHKNRTPNLLWFDGINQNANFNYPWLIFHSNQKSNHLIKLLSSDWWAFRWNLQFSSHQFCNNVCWRSAAKRNCNLPVWQLVTTSIAVFN